MSSFVIFDPRDNLIFHHCDPLFRKLLSEIRTGRENQWCDSTPSTLLEEAEDEDTEDEEDEDKDHESVRNLITLYLTPYVSALRDSLEDKVQLDFIPSIVVACKPYQEFIFLHLVHHKHVRHNEDTNCIILLQRKVNLFCQLTVFLCGNALYSVGKNKAILQLLFRMLSHWNEINLDIPFMLESIEKICVGFHIENLCKDMVTKMERNIKLELKTQQKEILSHCYVLYKEKLIYQHMSSGTQIHTEDLALILLLTLSLSTSDNSQEDVFNQQEDVYQNVNLKQQLVFLQSPSQIPVPYLFRKITISVDLHFVCLSEISSILMLSLPTLIYSVIRIKMDINEKLPPSSRSLEKLVTCVRNADKYIQHNFKSTSGLCSSINMNSLDSLTSLARKARHDQSELVTQQTDRILTHLMDRLHSSYETVFRSVYFEMVPQHIEAFSEIAPQISCSATLARLSMCIDFIRFKYDNQVILLASGLTTQHHLLAFIFVDRTNNYFVLHHQPQADQDVKALYQSLILQAYQKSVKMNQALVTWNEGEHYHSYYSWTSGSAAKQKHRQTKAMCNIVNIIQSEVLEQPPTHQSSKRSDCQRSNTNSKYKIYELFCIYSKHVSDCMIRDYIQTTANEIERHFN